MANKTNLKTCLIMSVFLMAMVCATAAGQTIYVDDDASVGGNGQTWGTAYKYLQDALAVADPCDEIWVVAGTYRPDDDTANHPDGSGLRTDTFELLNGVALYGGFPPGGGNWEDREPNDPNNETILSGDINTPGDNSDNSYHVVTGADNATLDGFTITDGFADGYWPDGYMDGAGIYCYESSPTIRNCIIRDNSTGDLGHGGGMLSDASNSTLVNCTFSKNSAGNYGGGVLNHLSNTTWIDCTFSENSTDGAAGGMFNWSSSTTLANCIFHGNSTSFDAGGGMLNYDSSVTLTNCLFSDDSTPHHGGGIYNIESDPTLINCTFSGNSADKKGGGLYNYACVPTVTNCIFWGNSDEGGTDESAQIDGSAPDVSYSCIQGLDDFDIEGKYNIGDDPCFVDPGYWDMNDVWVEGDYHLLMGSLCIDAGDNTAVPLDTTDLDGDGNTTEPIPWDLDGNPRIVDGNDDGNSVVDMGAFEAMVSCFGVNHVKIETKADKKGNEVELKGTFSPALPIDLAVDDVAYIIDDGLGNALAFLIPAGSFEVDGKPGKQKFKFHSAKGNQPDIKAKFDFDKCKFELKAKRVTGTDEITSTTLIIELWAGANVVEEVVQVQVKPKHLEYKREPKLSCCPKCKGIALLEVTSD